MRELSLNVLDIAQNSLSAGALVEIEVSEDTKADLLVIAVRDNGRGMTPEQMAQVRDPFYTTRTTRKVGMGSLCSAWRRRWPGAAWRSYRSPGRERM